MQKKSIDYKDVWDLLHEYIEAGKETDRRLKEHIIKTDLQFKEINRQLKEHIKKNRHQSIIQIKEADRQYNKTEKLLNETTRGMDTLKKYVGDSDNSLGTKVFFFNSFCKNSTIADMTFDTIYRNLGCKRKGLEDIFDIVCLNTSVAVIIETKYNFHPNDVETVLRKVDNFRILYPEYKDYKIFGGIVGVTIRPETIDAAKKLGFFVFTQEGNDIKILNDQVKVLSSH